MTEPRQILPDKTYKVERRVSKKRELIKDRPVEVKGIFEYCLAYAAKQSDVQVHAYCILPDKYLTVVSDPWARLPKFMRLLNRNVAKAINALQIESEILFVGKYIADVVEEETEVIEAMVETFLSPIEGMHAQSHGEWTLCSSPNGIGRKVKVKRPDEYFREGGSMPDEIELVLTPPPRCAKWGLKKLRRELTVRLDPKRTSGRMSEVDDETLRRKLARKLARCKAYRQFCAAYRRALELWRRLMKANSDDVDVATVIFPKGTYWMKHFCCVQCQV